MNNNKRSKDNHKVKEVVITIGVVIAVFVVLCFSPYGLAYINGKLNEFTHITINQNDYLYYMGAVLTGSVAISISFGAFIISRRADQRDDNALKEKLSRNKVELHEYLMTTWELVYNVLNGTGDFKGISDKASIGYSIDTLCINKIITDDEAEICKKIRLYVQSAADKTRSESDMELAKHFKHEFLKPGHGSQYNDRILELCSKLNKKE